MIIVLNMLVMCIEFYNQPKLFGDIFSITDVAFITIFIFEAALKLIGLGKHYFYSWWNVFDFAVVIASVFGIS